MRRSILGVAGALVALVVLSGSVLAATAVPFTNGSFENGTTGNFLAGSSLVPGWTIGRTDVDVADANVWPAQAGSKSLDLNGFGPGSISQAIPTVVNATYFVQFYMAGNPATHEQFSNGEASPVVKTIRCDGQWWPDRSLQLRHGPIRHIDLPVPEHRLDGVPGLRV